MTDRQADFLSRGLDEAEAQARLRRDGYNDLPSADRRSFWRIALGVLREPMFALLLGGGAIYLALGDLAGALTLSAFATLSVSIAVIQESRAERVLERLRDIASPRALVLRDGQRRRIPGRELVRGDLMLLVEGDRVSGDGVLVGAKGLLLDESLLTGESVHVAKSAVARDAIEATDGERALPRPGGENTPYVYAGTLVARGEGMALVAATGARSELGRIGVALRGIESEAPQLQRQTRRFVRGFALLGVAVSLLAVVLHGLASHDWLQAALGGIALGMSLLPEEIPLVLTAFMVMGARRLSQARVLTRRAAAIETLGAASVLCTDKTGTLTENRMALIELRAAGAPHEASWRQTWRAAERDEVAPGALGQLLRVAVLASARHPVDAMDRAVVELARRQGGLAAHYDGLELLRDYALRPELPAMTQVWAEPGQPQAEACIKGAPETVARLCRLDAAHLAALHGAIDAMAEEGVRVLAVGRALCPRQDLPARQDGFAFELLGLLGFADPLRASVPAAIAECRSARLRVVMVTGDYPVTARAIARQAGLGEGRVLDGKAVAALDDAQLAARVGAVDVFARILPEQKLRIVQALKANGAVVAMTGDGVNDAPALKAAHIGVAMGGRGTDVAREAASIVLLDDDFGSIVRTIRLGRRIYDNLRKATAYIVAVHVPIAGLALLPLLFGLPLMLLPVHIAFLEMAIDPACSIVFEAEAGERDVMARPPRRPDSRLLSGAMIGWSVLQGLLALGAVAAMLAFGLARQMPVEQLRALLFLTLVSCNVGLIFVNRSFSASLLTALLRPNRALWVLLGGVAAVLGLALAWPPARALFGFALPDAVALAAALCCCVALVLGLELLKPLWRRALRG